MKVEVIIKDTKLEKLTKKLNSGCLKHLDFEMINEIMTMWRKGRFAKISVAKAYGLKKKEFYWLVELLASKEERNKLASIYIKS